MGRSKALSRTQVMVDMKDLADLLNALHQANRGETDSLGLMVQHYRDASNPVRRLINQYNASVTLHSTPPEGEA